MTAAAANPPTVLHVARRHEWAAAEMAGEYRRSTADAGLADVGFVHCCTDAQLSGVLDRFYFGTPLDELLLLVIDLADCEAAGSAVRWEGDAEPFPHIYGPVPVSAVIEVRALPSSTEDLSRAERRLQAAQLAGDVEALDRLLDDRLVAIGPDGARYTKADDLAAHRSRTSVVSELVEEDLKVLVAGGTGVTFVVVRVAGTFDGRPMSARMRYTRTWTHDDQAGWRILAAHIAVLPETA